MNASSSTPSPQPPARRDLAPARDLLQDQAMPPGAATQPDCQCDDCDCDICYTGCC